VPVARRLGFDAIRAVRNATGLGAYSRHVLAGIAEADPTRELHGYTPVGPAAEFPFPAPPGTLHLPPRGWRTPALRKLWRTTRLGRQVAADGVQVYHGLTQEIPRDLPGTGVRSIVTVHDLLYVTRPELFPAIDRASYRWRYRWSVERADAIIAVSTGTRDDLVTHWQVDPARIAVVPPAADSTCFTRPTPDAIAAVRTARGLDGPYVIAVGTFEPRKNQQLLVAALAESASRELVLVLVGRDGGSREALEATAAKHGVAARVRMLEDVGPAELVALVSGALAANVVSTGEGFGMPIVEAMALGVPVVATRGANLDDAGGAAATYVAADDPAAVAAAT
jgi:glycosyltransferase involved in cell wall biosynthesis